MNSVFDTATTSQVHHQQREGLGFDLFAFRFAGLGVCRSSTVVGFLDFMVWLCHQNVSGWRNEVSDSEHESRSACGLPRKGCRRRAVRLPFNCQTIAQQFPKRGAGRTGAAAADGI
jgi:hypothetical protein